MPISDNIGGIQHKVNKSFSNVNGVWRENKKAYDNVSGVWRQTHTSAIEWTHEIYNNDSSNFRINPSETNSVDFWINSQLDHERSSYIEYTFREPLLLPPGSTITQDINYLSNPNPYWGVLIDGTAVQSATMLSHGTYAGTLITYQSETTIKKIRIFVGIVSNTSSNCGSGTINLTINPYAGSSFLLNSLNTSDR